MNKKEKKSVTDEEAIEYHTTYPPGKLEIAATKPLLNGHDLSLAYSPGVAAACELIEKEPAKAYDVTAKGNLIGVISNGTAVLGLGNIGPLASKPVMEGKAVLFKRFSGIDVFDIEVNETDVDKFCDVVASMEPTFGGVNLEDIKAPECFEIESKLKERMNIPVFHDDQHGTAIVAGAALINGLMLVDKKIEDVRVVCSGAGAAAISCVNMFVTLGVRRENIVVCDSKGVIHDERKDLNKYKQPLATKTSLRSLEEAFKGADVFLGLSFAGLATEEMVKSMADKPLIFALANPTPEIMPNLAKKVRPDCIVASGRSDFPNQVNNVLCFPYIFRGTLDVGATTINDEMKLACSHALAELARREVSEEITNAYGDENLVFGPEMIIPKPFDPRLMIEVAPAVAKAAMDSGVAMRPIKDIKKYKEDLIVHLYPSSSIMQSVTYSNPSNKKRITFTDGEDNRVLEVVQILVDEKMATPTLIGRREVIEKKISELNLRFKIDQDLKIFNPQKDNLKKYQDTYHEIKGRQGVNPDMANWIVRNNDTVLGSLMLHKGDCDSLICGLVGKFDFHMRQVKDIVGLKQNFLGSTAHMVLIKGKPIFITDTQIHQNPTTEQIVKITTSAAELVKSFGITPKVALLSAANFGISKHDNSIKMRRAIEILHEEHPDLEVDGEMKADLALDDGLRKQILPSSRLTGRANLLVMPTIEAANISYNLLKMTSSGGYAIGPILLGTNKPVHIVSGINSARGIFNMASLGIKKIN